MEIRCSYVGWAQGEWQSPKEPSKAVVMASGDGGTTFGAPYDLSQLTGSEHRRTEIFLKASPTVTRR